VERTGGTRRLRTRSFLARTRTLLLPSRGGSGEKKNLTSRGGRMACQSRSTHRKSPSLSRDGFNQKESRNIRLDIWVPAGVLLGGENSPVESSYRLLILSGEGRLVPKKAYLQPHRQKATAKRGRPEEAPPQRRTRRTEENGFRVTSREKGRPAKEKEKPREKPRRWPNIADLGRLWDIFSFAQKGGFALDGARKKKRRRQSNNRKRGTRLQRK